MERNSKLAAIGVAVLAAWVATSLAGLVAVDAASAEAHVAALASAPVQSTAALASSRLQFLLSGAVGAAISFAAMRFVRSDRSRSR